ncbi:ATP-dependent nuclease [Eggerthella timonensis]|uniref:ATP-dependent nuclease n=1 Tax=Eggerthella timonensis TaxID=1871008 RepID=UPI000C77BA0B|nr:AAA family ATPase [Eggerthella timonensis]
MIKRVLVRGFRILRYFEWKPKAGVNIIVGDNASGKSTILDAIELAMRCRLGGSKAVESLDPHWFNKDDVDDFYDSMRKGDGTVKPPAILIELYFEKDRGDIAHLQGANNSLEEDAPGIALSITVDDDLREEFYSVARQDERKEHLLPVEYYSVSWRSFRGAPLAKTPDSVACFRVDANPARSAYVVDYYARNTVDAHILDEEQRKIARMYRDLKQSIDEEVLSGIVEDDDEGIIEGISFQMDQSSRSDWRNSVTIQKEGLPLSLAGRGVQVEARTRLALKKAASKKVLLMEEPENHLSHTSLTRLMGLIESHLSGRQLFVTTHNAFVLNRLGLDKLALLSQGCSPRCIEDLSDDTVAYFRKQSGVDTLRIVLGKKIVLVEGPSDEMIFNWAYEMKHSSDPQSSGIDVISYGVRGKRALELASALNKGPVAVLRDNDGKPPEKWKNDAKPYLNDRRRMFVGENIDLKSLEPQMVAANERNLAAFAKLVGFDGVPNSSEIVDYMKDHKTDWAWAFVSCSSPEKDNMVAPEYIAAAVEFISQDE